MKKLLFGTSLLFNSIVSAGETGYVEINTIESYISCAMTAITSNQNANPANCPSSIKYIARKENVNSYLSILLAAKLSGKKVRIFLDKNTCYSGYPLIERVVI